MKVYELEGYLRNHSFPNDDVKIKVGDSFYNIRDVAFYGLEDSDDEIIIEVDIQN